MSVGSLKARASTGTIPVFSAFLTPSFVEVISSPGSATSPTVTVNVTAGVEPYTYSWLKLSGDPITINDDTSDKAIFSAQISNGVFQQSTWRVTVEDDTTATTTADITVIFAFESTL